MSDTTNIWLQDTTTDLTFNEDNLVVEFSDVDLISVAEAGPAGAPGISGATFSLPGDIVTSTGLSRYYMSSAGTLQAVIISVGIPSTNNVDITLRKNGTSIASVTLSATQYMITQSLAISFVAGDYFTVDVHAIDGKNLVVQLVYS